MISPKTVVSRISLLDLEITIEDLVVCAGSTSLCDKSKRGVVLISPDKEKIVWAANGPPERFECTKDDWCKANCNKVAVHAEERAIIEAKQDLWDWEMFHGKIVDGQLVSSGPPSCWQCSRMIVEAGIIGMWLYHEDGWKRYTAEEFHRLTLDYCLPR